MKMKSSELKLLGAACIGAIIGGVVLIFQYGFPTANATPVSVSTVSARTQLQVQYPKDTEVKLDVIGDGIRTVIVADKLPFTVKAPAGEGLYFWKFGLGVKAIERSDSLDVISAPKGLVEISVKSFSAVVDFDKKAVKYITKFGSISVAIGSTPGPNPPPDIPLTEFEKKVNAAITQDIGEGHGTKSKAGSLGQVFIGAAKEMTSFNGTVKDVFDFMKTAVGAIVSSSEFPLLKRVVSDELAAAITAEPGTKLDAGIRSSFALTFSKLGNAIVKVSQ